MMLSEYARRVDIDRAEVSRALNVKKAFSGVKIGRNVFVFVPDADKHFSFQPARPASRTIKPNVAAQKAKSRKEQNVSGPSEDINFDDPPNQTDSMDVLQRRQAYERSRQLKIKNDLAEGATYLRDDVINTGFEKFRGLRDAMLAVAPRVAPLLMKTTQKEKERIIKEEIVNVLSSLTGNIDVDDEELKKKIATILLSS